MKKSIVLLLAMVGCFMFLAPAFAATYGTANVSESVGYAQTGWVTMSPYFAGANVYAGSLNLNITPVSGLVVPSQLGFCIEAQYAGGNYLYDIVDVKDAPNTNGPGGNPMGAIKAGWINKLYGSHYSNAMLTNSSDAAAFQLAIWEIVYDTPGSWNVNSGNFYATGFGALGTAQTWLNGLTTSSPGFSGSLVALTNRTQQDYIAVAPVPEPGTIFAALSILAPAGLAFRRKRA